MVETIHGRGRLVLLNRTYNVEYELSGDRGRVIGLSHGDLDFAMDEDESARLVFEDRRSVRILVENEAGDFKLAGAIEPSA
jgi:hypothetical protein